MKRICAAAFGILTLSLFLGACVQLITPKPDLPPAATATVHVIPPRPIKTSVPNANATRRATSTRKASATITESSTPTASFTITSTSTSTFTLTPSPTPSATITVTATITLSPTAFYGAVPTLFPMSIVAMRHGSYPGSEIKLDEELAEGANYRRYYVYYLSQGLKIYALLTVPDGEMPADGWPGIIFNHGYIPPSEYRTTERYINYVDRLARQGYVVFRIDYRGHGNSEGTAQGAYGDPGYEVDVLNAIASLKRYPLVNPNKIGMWGHSMGGYLTLRSMVISHDVKVGVIWAGVVGSYADILEKWPNGLSDEQAISRKWMDDWPTEFGTPDENPAFWNSISANNYLADLSGPIQLHYGTNDEEVPPQFSETLASEINQADGNVEIYAYPGDNHNLSNYFNPAMDRTIEFFDSILK